MKFENKYALEKKYYCEVGISAHMKQWQKFHVLSVQDVRNSPNFYWKQYERLQ